MHIFTKFRLKVTGWQAGENRLEILSANIFAGNNIGWLQFWSVKLPSNKSIQSFKFDVMLYIASGALMYHIKPHMGACKLNVDC